MTTDTLPATTVRPAAAVAVPTTRVIRAEDVREYRDWRRTATNWTAITAVITGAAGALLIAFEQHSGTAKALTVATGLLCAVAVYLHGELPKRVRNWVYEPEHNKP